MTKPVFADRTARMDALAAIADERVLILDGPMGTEIQKLGLGEDDFRPADLADHPVPLKGDNDLLNLSRPDAIKAIHASFVDAGADVVESNTFNATSISQADYDLAGLAPAIAEAGAKLAREVALESETPERPIIVAGAIGPLSKTLSLSPDVNNPGHREVTFAQVHAAYREQADAMAAHVDCFLIETVFDTLNCKAAIKALMDREVDTGETIPILISGTITDASGRTLSGQTPEAFWNSVRHAKPWAVGLNCALGAADMRAHIAEIARIADCRTLAYPNAGLPNAMGEYDETPSETAGHLGEWAHAGLVNLVGGCCGTTPEHIAAIKRASVDATPRTPPTRPVVMRLSGLEPFELGA